MAARIQNPDPSQLQLLVEARFPLIPLNQWDAVGVLGRMVGKAPVGRDWWNKKPLTLKQAAEHMDSGGNIGIPLGKPFAKDQYLCCYDIDRKNLLHGNNSVKPLVKHIANDLDVGIADLVVHQSGNNGLHIFFLSSEPDLKGIVKIDGIKVEVKSAGQQVVAPGSIHPDTFKLYQVHPKSTAHQSVPVAPPSLVASLRKRKIVTTGPQIIPPSRLNWIAEQLQAAIFDEGSDILFLYDDWLRIGMAFHAASGGECYGLEAWILCSDSGEADHCQYKWHTFELGEVTEKTLNWFLAEAGVDPTEAPLLTRDEVLEYIVDDFAELEEDEDEAPAKPERRLFTLGELINLPEPEWLLTSAIPKNGLVALYGPPKSAKTFLAIDIALSIATGQGQVHGLDGKQGRVLYVLAEGGAPMMGNRARAWLKAKGMAAVDDFAVFPYSVTLGSRKSVDELLALAGNCWDLVIFDTLARCMDGDENAVKDMNLAIKGCDYIRRRTGAAVLLVHHSGKDQSKGLRGSTALLGAVDATIKMRTQGTMGGFELSVPELRHGEPPEPKWLSLQSTGDSAVLVGGTPPANAKKGSAADVIDFIGRMIEDGTSRKEVTDEIADQFGFTDRTARRRIVDHIPFGKENAVEEGGVSIWREADLTSSSPKAEVIRTMKKA